jgi:hypothetical protein
MGRPDFVTAGASAVVGKDRKNWCGNEGTPVVLSLGGSGALDQQANELSVVECAGVSRAEGLDGVGGAHRVMHDSRGGQQAGAAFAS